MAHESHADASTSWPTVAELRDGAGDPSAFLRLALRIVDALAELHRGGVVHRELGPRAILRDPATGEVQLLAPSGESTEQWLAGQPADAPAYMAPELLRTVGPGADLRADLYSLGVVLYELLLGARPFEAPDLLGWIHRHVAQAPRPPAEVDANVPPALAGVLLKLLMKAPEERYQSCRSLRADLERCRDELARTGTIATFPLAERDVPETLRLPNRLYGRDEEVSALLAAVERVADAGDPELVLVAGYSGVGKSALVQELYRPIARHYGFFIAGKFEQYKRDVPYATIVQAFGELVRQLLATSESRLAAWRQQLQAELGASAQILVDLIPQLGLILGHQAPAAPVPASEAQNRFNRVMRQFVGVFARAEHPLAIFLDDLQWADAASLRLLQHLITRSELRHLLVICAYRDNEIDGSHPWTAVHDDIVKSGVPISRVALGPLARAHVESLLADTFACERARAAELAALVHEKTLGNPFFVGQLLTTLHAEGLLRFDQDAGAWTWDVARVRAVGHSENIALLMVGKLRKLPDANQAALQIGACLGAEFRADTVALITGQTEAEVLADLAPSILERLLIPQGPALQFLHDRVQQAAYSLIPEAERAGLHLRIGRHLRAALADAPTSEALFEVVNHLNAGAASLTDPAERRDLARLDLEAGVRAKQSTAYGSARIYLDAGMAMLPDDAWRRDYALQFALHRERAECEWMCGHGDVAESLFATALARAGSTLDLAQIQAMRISLYYSTGRMLDAISVGLATAQALGVDIPASPEARRALLAPELARMDRRMAELDIDGLEFAAYVEDPLQRVTSDVLLMLVPPAFYADIELFTLVVLRLIDLSLAHGETEGSVVGYAMYGLLLVSVRGDLELAGRLARMTIRRVDAANSALLRSRIYTLYGWFLGVWHEPFARIPGFLQTGYQAGLETGDLLYAGFALLGLDTGLLSRAPDLAHVEAQWAAHAAPYAEMQHAIAVQTVKVVLDALPRLSGSGGHTPGDPDALLKTELAGTMNSAVGTYYILRAQRAYLFGEYEEALAMSEGFESVKAFGLLGTYFGTEGTFYHALSAAALLERADESRRPQLLATLQASAAILAGHAARNPASFADRSELLAAELARVEGRPLAALQGYERASRSARAGGFLANEAIALECMARLYTACGLVEPAELSIKKAHAVYVRWGAHVKVHALELQHPWLVRATPERSGPHVAAPSRAALSLDMLSVVKASQALSGEILLDRLLAALMRVVIEYAGAERGVFLVQTGGALAVSAVASVGAQGTAVEVTASHVALGETLAESAVQYVARTGERILLNDPAERGTFAADPYILRVRPRSVLCTPVLRGSNLVGVLYLENNWISGAFTADRLSLLELIAAQAAISLENANLYADLARENAERRQAESTLQASEERMRQLVESADVIPWEADATTDTFKYVGPQAATMLGYPLAAWYADDNFLLTIADPEDRDLVAEHRQRARSEAPGRELEFRVRDAAGREVWLSSIIGQVPEGAPRYRGFLFNCTERKLSEAELRDKLAIIEAQREAIRVMSTPIIAVWDGVLTMPLFGAIDTGRASLIQEQLLETVVRTQAWAAILDLTGVGLVDTATADHIIKLVRAVELLGARGIVVGIRPDVAQSIVALGVDLTRILTLSNLREALVLCMQQGRRLLSQRRTSGG